MAFFTDPLSNLQIVIGPALVLGLGQAAYIARMARSSLLEVVREDYVRTARAKGLNGRLVIALHALPNALLPVMTLSGILLGFVLAGSIPVERAFGTPGLGYAMYTAVSERDIFVMQNLVFLYSDRLRAAEHLGRSDLRLARSEDPLPMSVTQPDAVLPLPSRSRAAEAVVAAARSCACCARFARRSPMSAFWGCVAAGIVFMAVAAPVLAPYDPTRADFRQHGQAADRRCTISAPTRSAATR